MKININDDDFLQLPIWKMILLVVLMFFILALCIVPFIYLYIFADFTLFSNYIVITYHLQLT